MRRADGKRCILVRVPGAIDSLEKLRAWGYPERVGDRFVCRYSAVLGRKYELFSSMSCIRLSATVVATLGFGLMNQSLLVLVALVASDDF
jgi:hypothetical protein